MPVARLALCVLLATSVTACSTWFRDRASDYRTVEDQPALVLPEGSDTRPIRPLYPVPAGEVGQWDMKKKMKAPQPKPLVINDEAVASQPANTPQAPQRPVLTQDGNGYPLVSVEGDFYAVWDRVGEALKAANVNVDDRNQGVGLYYLKLNDANGKPAIYQLRVSRGQSACMLMLQQDDDTLAPQATAKALFESIVRYWPLEPGETDGKARPALHR